MRRRGWLRAEATSSASDHGVLFSPGKRVFVGATRDGELDDDRDRRMRGVVDGDAQ